MLSVPIHHNLDQGKRIFLITEPETMLTRYAIVVQRSHTMGYLNVDKAEWEKVAEDIRHSFFISFEGIEGSDQYIPNKLGQVMPVTQYDYWIGVDNFGEEKTSYDETTILTLLELIFLRMKAQINA